MARETIVRLVDDLDGGEAVETVSFGLDNVLYEIDLSEDNSQKLRESLAVFVGHSRRAAPARKTRLAALGSRGTIDRERSSSIRTWAKAQGIKVNDRGRIPAAVVEQYDAAH